MSSLFLVYLDPDEGQLETVAAAVRLKSGVYVFHTDQTRSHVYHRVKALADPGALLVAELQDSPKFKGMEGGALKAMQKLIGA